MIPKSGIPKSGIPEPTILHLDLDAFFASVEQLLEPSLRGRPVIVGGLGRRGVVAAASYEARRFGVRSAMPSGRARQLCPHGVFVPPHHGAYSEYSVRVMAILRDTTPLVEQLSVDEAFLDVSGIRRHLGDAPAVAVHLRSRIRHEIGLAASVGVATTKFLAKVASDLAKPDGLLVVEPCTELAFLHPLPVRRLWGVGPKTQEKLERFGVSTIGDIARLPIEALVGTLGSAAGNHLHDLAHNHDPRPVVTERDTKSIGHEETFSRDLTDRVEIERELLRLVDSVAARLRAAEVRARTITLKARYPDFTTLTRAHTVALPTDASTTIAAAVRELLHQVDLARGLRLVGVHCSNLVSANDPVQGVLALDVMDPARDAQVERRAQVERTMDSVRRRFGHDALRSATLLEPFDAENEDPAGEEGAVRRVQ